jgi:hypothetical protein
MKIVSIYSGKLGLAALLSGLVFATTVISAWAGLGGDVSLIASDAAAMQGHISQPSKEGVEQSTSFNVKQFLTSNGVAVREYAAPSGPVFGVAWEGRRPPDLSVLLGSYYPEYAAQSRQNRHPNLHHAVITGPNVVVVMGGHMGHLIGRAYVPSLAPSGVDAKAVVK